MSTVHATGDPMRDAGPTGRRRRLGLELLALRNDCGWSAEEAGLRGGVSKATVSRYERGNGTVRWGTVELLCRAYGASDEQRESLVRLAKNSSTENSWWRAHAAKLSDRMQTLIGLEDESPKISHHALVVAPALLQIPEYARSIRPTPLHELPAAEVDDLLDLRMRRQHILDRPSPPNYQVILDEGILRRAVGSPSTMVRQLDHLLARGKQRHITIQVLPFSAGASIAALHSFILFGGQDPRLDVIFIENQVGSHLVEDPAIREEYTAAMGFLRQQALTHSDSAVLIREARDIYANHSSH